MPFGHHQQKGSRDRRQQRGYQVKKSSVKDELIDRQILAIHMAMVEKILNHPELHQQVFDILEERLAAGKIRYGGYMAWFSLMDNIDNQTLFKQGVLENSPRMKRLRRSTPFVGIITEEERETALRRAACGEIDIDSLIY